MKVIKPSRPDPDLALGYIKDVFRSKLWSKQEEIIRCVFGTKRRTVVRACHSIGKTFTAANAAAAWLISSPYRTVITTAPTGRQVRELLWKEIRKIHDAAKNNGTPLGGYMPPSAPEWRIDREWMAIGFTSNDPVNLQGWHCQGGTLVILDEAPGVKPDVWDALQGVMTGAYDRLLAIGNPTESRGPFYEAFKDEQNARVTLSAFDSPNVRAGRDDVVPGLVTLEWVEDSKRKWGEDSPIYRSRVLGEFPDNDDDVLVPLAWAEEAVRRHDDTKWEGPLRIGLDVARYGPDSTVAVVASEQGIKQVRRFRKADTMETAGFALMMMKENPSIEEVRVDADGLGAGVYDALNVEIGTSAIEMRGGMSPMDKERFLNYRSEWLWNLRTRLVPDSKNPMSIPNDERLIAQLTSVKWTTNRKGLIQIESKDEIRKRLHCSPDELDAMAYACADIGQAASVSIDPSVGYRSNPWSV